MSFALFFAVVTVAPDSGQLRVAPQNGHNELTRAERREGFELLFDGKSLRNFRAYKRDDVPKGWVVKGGEIKGDEVVGGTLKPVPDNLSLLEGVGEALEQKLYESGYLTYESILEANVKDLAAVNGVSDDSAKGLRKQAKIFSKKKAKGQL